MKSTAPPFDARLKRTKALSKVTKITETAGKQHVRQALVWFEPNQGDRSYHFPIDEPLGATLQRFLDISRSHLLQYVQDLTYRLLHALEFIHGAQVIHARPLLHSII
jgi:hypothetical protein